MKGLRGKEEGRSWLRTEPRPSQGSTLDTWPQGPFEVRPRVKKKPLQS